MVFDLTVGDIQAIIVPKARKEKLIKSLLESSNDSVRVLTTHVLTLSELTDELISLHCEK